MKLLRLLMRVWGWEAGSKIAALYLILLVLSVVMAPWISPFAPDRADILSTDLPPDSVHLLGTDHLGRDVLSRLLYGGRLSLEIAASAVLIAGVFGVLIGAVAGRSPSLLGNLLMRLTDLFLALPTFFLIVALQSLQPPGVTGVVLVIALTTWPLPARLVYGQLLSLRERDFVVAARAIGAKPGRILFQHLLPQIRNSLLVYLALGAADAILVEASLSFLGLGVPPYEPSWGTILADAQRNILNSIWWTALFPGIAIFLTVLAINQLSVAFSFENS